MGKAGVCPVQKHGRATDMTELMTSCRVSIQKKERQPKSYTQRSRAVALVTYRKVTACSHLGLCGYVVVLDWGRDVLNVVSGFLRLPCRRDHTFWIMAQRLKPPCNVGS